MATIAKINYTMHTSRYIQYLKLPPVPEILVTEVLSAVDDIIASSKSNYGNYHWSDFKNQQIDEWCKENICQDMYWGFQAIQGDLDIHQDIGTKTKLIYLLSTGGPGVKTSFWDQGILLDEYLIPNNCWHVLKADTFHSVSGIVPGQIRFSITGKIF
jgi:hypothetical protein